MAVPTTSTSSPRGGDALAWLRTKQGKLTAGTAAAAIVVVLALRQRGQAKGGGGFSPSAIQPTSDETIRSQLDQLGAKGGTLAEVVGSTQDLNTTLRDLLEAQNPLPVKAANLRAEQSVTNPDGTRQVVLAWDPIPGASAYAVRAKGGDFATESQPMHRALYLPPGQYTYYVTPIDQTGQRFGAEAAIDFTA